VILNEETLNLVARGRPVPVTDPALEIVQDQEVALIGPAGELAALAKGVEHEGRLWAQPHKVFLSQE
jgi:hypothetical protein